MSGAEPPGSPPIRLARADDAEALATLEAVAFPHPWSAAQLSSELRQPVAIGWVTVQPSGIAGYALFRRVLDEAELLRLAVHPERRRQGLASALAAHGLAHLRDTGCVSTFLEVREDNEAAIGFYERSGWRADGRRRCYYPDGADALLYRRTLSAKGPGSR